MKNIRIFYLKIFIFSVMEFSMYELTRRVFLMIESEESPGTLPIILYNFIYLFIYLNNV